MKKLAAKTAAEKVAESQELQKVRDILRQVWLAIGWPSDWINEDGTASNSADAIQALPQVVGRIFEEHEQLLQNAGFGGYSESAPEEMWIYGMGSGCDTWIHLDRATVMNGKPEETILKKHAERGWEGPVKYIRADLARRTA